MKTVSEILKIKGNNVWSISPDSTVYDALKLMSEKEVGALLVLEDKEIVGILSERDYARKIVLHGKFSKETLVREIMSVKVMYVNPSTSTEECMALMINKRVRHLPVFEDNKLVGLVSIGDIVKALIDEKEFVIDQLVHYITGIPA
jgi:CBS domain-containing protein